jgi:hypothetical protein
MLKKALGDAQHHTLPDLWRGCFSSVGKMIEERAWFKSSLSAEQ